MAILEYSFFTSASDLCDFVNSTDIVLKHVVVKVVEDHHGIPHVSYVAFYEEKEDGKTN